MGFERSGQPTPALRQAQGHPSEEGSEGECACGLGEAAFLLRDGLGTVALCIDDAEKTKGLIAVGQKLMGGPGSNVHGVKRLHLPGLIVQHHPPLSTYRNHHMRMGMFL